MKVQSTVRPDKIEILGNKVLIRSNIVETEKVEENGNIQIIFKYDEVVYEKDEYIRIISIKNSETEEVVEIIDKKLEANLNATRKLVKQSTLTDEKLIEFVNIYPSWEIGKVLEIDDVLKYNDELYRVIQSHTTQSDWTPNISQSLFTKIQPANVIPIWVQPTGSHDAYDIDDKVEFEGSVYESTIDANTYSPTAYPAGWNVV